MITIRDIILSVLTVSLGILIPFVIAEIIRKD